MRTRTHVASGTDGSLCGEPGLHTYEVGESDCDDCLRLFRLDVADRKEKERIQAEIDAVLTKRKRKFEARKKRWAERRA